MAGEAKTNKFMIGEATIMIGPMANVFDLAPSTHSIGLVKNFAIQVESSNVELTQGVENVPVFSVQNGFSPSFSCEVYEYTARNLAYGLGLDASGAAYDELATSGPHSLTAATAAAAAIWAVSATHGFVVGDWLIAQMSEDIIFTSKVTVVSVNNITTERAAPAAPASWTTALTRIFRAKRIDGVSPGTNFVAVKAVVIMPLEKRPVTMYFPKVRITKGFSLAISTSDYGNLPFEFMPFPLVSTDTMYSSFPSGESFITIQS
jgi:hypothetical protein